MRSYVDTEEAKSAVAGRERDILAALGIKLPLRRLQHIRCPYGTHPDRHPSWRWDAAKGMAFCTCNHTDIFGVVRKVRGDSFGDAKLFCVEVIGRSDLIRGDGSYRPAPEPVRPVLVASNPIPTEDENLNYHRAMDIWDESTSITGTLAESYLVGRHINPAELPAGINDAIRFHSDCPFGDGRSPCLIGLFTNVITGDPQGIQRIALTGNAEIVRRMMLGPTSGGIIRPWPDDTVEQGLVLGEGVETTLAAATRITRRDGTLYHPAWAVGDAGHMASFPVLPGIDAITLLVDHDPAGQEAALQCAYRWETAGRQVLRTMPANAGDDFNDLVKRLEITKRTGGAS